MLSHMYAYILYIHISYKISVLIRLVYDMLRYTVQYIVKHHDVIQNMD